MILIKGFGCIATIFKGIIAQILHKFIDIKVFILVRFIDIIFILLGFIRHQVLNILDAVVHSTCPGAGALVTEFFTSVFIHSGQQLSKHVVRHMVASSRTASSSAATTTFS